MTLLELLFLSRRQLDDLFEIDDTDALWSTVELKEYINRAVVESCLRADLIIDSETPSICMLDIIAGTASYLISPKILDINRLVYGAGKNVLYRIGHRNLDRREKGWEQNTGEPTSYMLDMQQRKIFFNFIPEADATVYLTVSRLPILVLSADDDMPEIPEQYHYDLVYWVKKLAYEKRDSEANNLDLSRFSEESFERVFGLRPEARWLVHQLKGRKYKAVGDFL